MKRGQHQVEKKTLSTTGLLATVQNEFGQIPLPPEGARGRKQKISLSDCLMSGLAMFSLKSPSLLAFDKHRAEPTVCHNLKSLYKIQDIPSDTYIREVLDEVDPRYIRSCFLSVFQSVQRGKVLEEYTFLNGTVLILVDGSGVFESNTIHCENCCKKEHKDGRVSYYHQILAAVIASPHRKQVIPLCPEPITKQDGATKNDCERNAFNRFFIDLKREHPRLKATLVSDALSANAPHVNLLKSNGYSFIITVKPDGNRFVFDFVKGVTEEFTYSVQENEYRFRYANNVPLNGTKDAPSVNFLECEATERIGRKIQTKHFAWITDHEITKENAYQLMLGGRARWKIENETFNTLKNQGYQFEHNFGHGKKNLHTVLVLLMMLAFAIDQIQEACCGLFQAALQRRGSRRSLWEDLRGCFRMYLISSWADLWKAMSVPFIGVPLPPNTS